MSTSMIAGGVALIAAFGLVVTLGGLSLLSGALHFLFARPRLEILKAKNKDTGFAFGFKWDSAREPATFDKVKIRLFNPFGSPTQVEISQEFRGQGSTFATEVDFGVGMRTFWDAKGLNQATVQIELTSLRDGVTQQFEMKGQQFKIKVLGAKGSVDEFNEKYKIVKEKPLFQTVERSFIAEPIAATNPTLKIATNPLYTADFAAAAAPAAGGAAADTFAVSKVWIEPGCIVCDACEGIFPEVFDVQDETCVIRPDAPLTNGLLIQEAAEACPVEVIKFTKAS